MHTASAALSLLVFGLAAGCYGDHVVAPDGGETFVDAATPTADAAAEPHWEDVRAPLACTGHTATRLSDGSVLVVGACMLDGTAVWAVRFDPPAGALAPIAVAEPRSAHAAVVRDDGVVLLVGGVAADGTALATVERFDGTGFALEPARLGTARSGVAAAWVTGTLWAAGGHVGGDGFDLSATVERMDGSAWTSLTPLAEPCAGAALLTVGGPLMLVGGVGPHARDYAVPLVGGATVALGDSCPTPRALVGEPRVVCGSAIVELDGVGAMHRVATLLRSRSSAGATRLTDGSVLVVGGTPYTSTPSAEQIVGDVSVALPPPHYEHLWSTATALLDGRALVVGEGGSELFVPRAVFRRY